jgi:hypothetical protein
MGKGTGAGLIETMNRRDFIAGLTGTTVGASSTAFLRRTNHQTKKISNDLAQK